MRGLVAAILLATCGEPAAHDQGPRDAPVFVPGELGIDDPLRTDADKYTRVLETEEVRVLLYRDAPGESTHAHRHPSSILFALSPFHRRTTSATGRQHERAFATGAIVFERARAHVAENTGSTRSNALVIELKRW